MGDNMPQLSLVDTLLRKTHKQLREVKYPTNMVRLRVLQRAFFNECLRLNSDAGENASIFKEINQCNEIASQIVNKIGELRKKHKEQTSVENRKEKGDDTEAPRRKVGMRGRGTLKEAPCSSTNIGIKRKAPVGNAPKPLSVSINQVQQRGPSNATAGQHKRKKIAAAKAKTSEGVTKTKSQHKGTREKRDNFLAPNLKYGEPALVWQGSPSKETHSRIYYDACVLGRSKVVATLVRPGDTYLLSTGDSSEKPYIAYCRAVYFDKKSREAKMTVQWFFRYGDLPKHMKKEYKETKDGRTSIFLSSQIEENPIESVLARAQVLYSCDSAETKKMKESIPVSTGLLSVFHCEDFFNVGSGKMTSLVIKDFKARKPATMLFESRFREELDHLTFLFPLNLLGVSGSDGGKHGVHNRYLLMSKAHNQKAGLNLNPDGRSARTIPESERKDDGKSKGGKHTTSFLPLMGKRSCEILNLKHAGQYKYYIEGGSSFTQTGNFTIQGKKNLEQSNLRAKQGHFRGFEQACALLSDLNNHRMASTRNGGRHVPATSTIQIFLHPVDLKDYPDYLDIVRKPMDFNIINERLDTYQSFDDFAADVNQIFENCFLYNPPEKSYEVCALASGLQHYFRKACKAIKISFSDEDTKEITAAPPKMSTESPNEDLMSMFEESSKPFSYTDAVEL